MKMDVLGSSQLQNLEVPGAVMLGTGGNSRNYSFSLGNVGRNVTAMAYKTNTSSSQFSELMTKNSTFMTVFMGKQGDILSIVDQSYYPLPLLVPSTISRTPPGPSNGSFTYPTSLRVTGDVFCTVGRSFVNGLLGFPLTVGEFPIPNANGNETVRNNAIQGGSIFVEGVETESLPRGKHLWAERTGIGTDAGTGNNFIFFGGPGNDNPAGGLGATLGVTPDQWDSTAGPPAIGYPAWQDILQAHWIVGNYTTDISSPAGLTNFVGLTKKYVPSNKAPIDFPKATPWSFDEGGGVTSVYSNYSFRSGPPLQFAINPLTLTSGGITGGIVLPNPTSWQTALEYFLGPLPPLVQVAVDFTIANYYQDDLGPLDFYWACPYETEGYSDNSLLQTFVPRLLTQPPSVPTVPVPGEVNWLHSQVEASPTTPAFGGIKVPSAGAGVFGNNPRVKATYRVNVITGRKKKSINSLPSDGVSPFELLPSCTVAFLSLG